VDETAARLKMSMGLTTWKKSAEVKFRRNTVMISIALLGCGTVGAGVYKLMARNREIIAKKTGVQVAIKKVLEKDRRKCLDLNIPEDALAADFEEILNDPSIDMVVELFGGIEPAFSYIIEAMKRGKHVVTPTGFNSCQRAGNICRRR
jgi:homoserine dehydrogenase